MGAAAAERKDEIDGVGTIFMILFVSLGIEMEFGLATTTVLRALIFSGSMILSRIRGKLSAFVIIVE